MNLVSGNLSSRNKFQAILDLISKSVNSLLLKESPIRSRAIAIENYIVVVSL